MSQQADPTDLTPHVTGDAKCVSRLTRPHVSCDGRQQFSAPVVPWARPSIFVRLQRQCPPAAVMSGSRE